MSGAAGPRVAASGAMAVVCALAAPVVLVLPSLPETVGLGVALVGFGTGFVVAAGLIIRHVERRPTGPRLSVWSLFAGTPRRLGRVLVAVTLLGAGAGLVGFVSSSGYSADSPRSGSCPWVIARGNGGGESCVSHDRWLRVRDDTELIFLGVMAVLLSAACAAVASEDRDGRRSGRLES